MNTTETELLNNIIDVLPSVTSWHAKTTPQYKLFDRVAKAEAARVFAGEETNAHLTGVLGDLKFPFHKMGNITSLNLFELDELIIFSFYWLNRSRYKKAIDLGANIGLHSIAMSRCGYEVKAFEPDPSNYKTLQRNLDLNRTKTVNAINAAVSDHDGEMEFVRVLNNLTGNHLAGSKSNLYGDLETIKVRVEAFKPLLAWADLAKIDVEGHENTLILSTSADDWKKCDAVMEIGNAQNADVVFNHLHKNGVGMFAQKLNWQRVEKLEHMPTSYKEGSLFVTMKSAMPWA